MNNGNKGKSWVDRFTAFREELCKDKTDASIHAILYYSGGVSFERLAEGTGLTVKEVKRRVEYIRELVEKHRLLDP